jgi:hypothetical protein
MGTLMIILGDTQKFDLPGMFEVPLTTSNVGAVITKTDFSNMFW